MSGNLGAVLRKEMLDAVRDKRSVAMLAMFVLIYPLIMWVTLNNNISKATRTEREITEVLVIGGERAPTLLQRLKQEGIAVIARSNMDEAAITGALRQRKQAAVVKIPEEFSGLYQNLRPARIELWFDSAVDDDERLHRVQSVLRSYGNDIARSRLLAHGVSPALLMPAPLQLYDTAPVASRSGRFIGAIFGIFFVATFYFCLNVAIDATAGERERRSLEILLAQPVRPLELITGKWLAATGLCAVGLSLELLVGHYVLKSMPLEEIGLSWRLGLPSLLLLAVTALPLCLFAASLEIALAMNSKSFKEAQTTVGFALLLPIIPVLVVPMMDVGTQQWMYAIPVLAEQTLLLELAKGNAISVQSFLTTAGVSLAAAAICIGLASLRLKSERFVLGV